MYPYKKEDHSYTEAIKLKHDSGDSIAKEYNAKKTEINISFDAVEDVAKFNEAVFKSKNREKVYIVEPNFINPRKLGDIYTDFSENCTIM
ncbi:unnamed protein product [Rhizopus stolonifer]